MRTLLLSLSVSVLVTGPAWAAPNTDETKVLTAADVRKAVRAAQDEGEPAMVALAAALGRTGGRPALEGLTDLCLHSPRRDHEPVRIAALKALARVNLRGGDVVKCIKWSRRGSLEEREAGILAMGALGTGRDMPALLELATSEEPRIQRATYRALRSLTGVSIPNVHARWLHWWRSTVKRTSGPLQRALAGLEEDPKAEGAKERVETLAQQGWVDPEPIEDAISDWLRSSDALLQATACRLASRLRLADFGPRIAKIRVSGFDPPELEKAIRAALATLGMAEELAERVSRKP